MLLLVLVAAAPGPVQAGEGWLKRGVSRLLKPASWRWVRSLRRTQPRPGQCRLIPIGSDHAGFALKQHLKGELRKLGYQPMDMGTHSAESVDYPDFAHRVAGAISRGQAQRGVLVCGTGIGMSMAANKHHNVRAAVVWSPEIAEVTRRHNDANVLALPARHLSEQQADQILRRFLDTPFDGGRHLRRVQKIEP